MSKIYEKLVRELKELLHQETQIGFAILKKLKDMEESQSYLAMGFSYLFVFCVEELKMSETQAYVRVNATKEMMLSPILEEKLKTGEIKATQAVEMRKVKKELREQGTPVSREQSDNLVLELSGKTFKETKKILHDTLTPNKPRTQKIILEVDEETIKQFEAFKAEHSHKIKTGSDVDAFKLLLKNNFKPSETKNTKNPPKSDSNQTESSSTFALQVPTRKNTVTHSRYIPKAHVEFLKQRSSHQCEFTDQKTGRRCTEKHFL